MPTTFELSAERYGFRAKIAEIGKAEWMQASHDAMDFRQTGTLAGLLDRVTSNREPHRSSAKEVRDPEARAVKAIKDPKRRAEAQLLVDQIRQNRNKGQKGTEQAARKSRRPGYDFDR